MNFISKKNISGTILDGIIEREGVAICGIILAELFHGINSNREKVHLLLSFLIFFI
jgi:predicted nucleic acid-binding protein